MSLDRRSFLLSLASSAAMLALPGSASAALDAECFAAARRDDRGNFSAALFTLNGDVRAVELPQRGHDITLKPDGREWVAFARRPGRFGVAIPLDARPPVWFAAKPDRHFFGHGVFSADGRLLYTTENDYKRVAGVIGVRDATASYKQIGEFPAHGLEPHDIALLADGRTMVIANGGIRTHPDRGDDELNIPDMQPSGLCRSRERRSHRGAASRARLASAVDPASGHRGRRRCRIRLPISRAGGGCTRAGRFPPPWRGARHCRGSGRDADGLAQLCRLGCSRQCRGDRGSLRAQGRPRHLLGRSRAALSRHLKPQ